MNSSSRPFLSAYTDRHGKRRWRFRRKNVAVALPGQPGDEAFEAAYAAAFSGQPTKADVVRHPNHSRPRSLKAAWRLAVQAPEWKMLRPATQIQYIDRAERFLTMPIPGGSSTTYTDIEVASLRRRHIKSLLAAMGDRPHAAADLIVVLRKMITAALDQDWIEHDPTHRLRFSPKIIGHRAWTDEERALFEKHWPLGSMPRTVYALALGTGQRRGDLVRIRWDGIKDGKVPLVQQKTGKRLVLPVLPFLQEALDAAPKYGEYVLSTQRGAARSVEGITNDFQRWTEAAGLKACTLHGLRKTLGKILAEEGATTRELMDVLGHDAIAHAALYSREAEQQRMAEAGLAKVRRRLHPRLEVVAGDPLGEPFGEPGFKPLK